MYYFKKFIKTKLILIVILVLSLTLSFLLSTGSVFASANDYVIVGGDAIGLKIDTGVYVAGKYQVSGKSSKLSPWKNSDIEEGDRILSCNGYSVFKINDLNKFINSSDNNIAILELQRGDNKFSTNIEVVETINGERTIGLYVKDRLIGIGTLTFINPENNTFASLGHGITDNTITYGNISGEVVLSKIEGIKKGVPGASGEKRASISSVVIGNVLSNTITGVYGKINNDLHGKKVRLAKQNEIKKGKAKMYTVVENEKVESFDIEVISVSLQDSTNVKGLKIKVIDNRLLDISGGIVQGMSGSPIIQDDLLIGAVSHVSLEDPRIGYAMHIGWMYEETKKY